MTRVDEQDRAAVCGRGLWQGTMIGALIAVPFEAALMVSTQWHTAGLDPGVVFDVVLAALLYAPVGAFFGAFAGFGCALIPSIAVAAAPGYFRRRPGIAVLGLAAIGLAVQVAVFAVGDADHAYLGFALFGIPWEVGIALAMAVTPYVLTGRGFRIGRGAAASRFGLVSGLP